MVKRPSIANRARASRTAGPERQFEQKVIEKRQTHTDEIERRILAMYAKEMFVREIEDQLRDVYGAEVIPALISSITDKILQTAASCKICFLFAVFDNKLFYSAYLLVERFGLFIRMISPPLVPYG